LHGTHLSIIFLFVNVMEATMPDTTLHLTCTGCGRTNRLPAARVADRPTCAACGHALNDGTVASIDLARLERASQSDDLPLLVDFWAPWCGPCRMMAPEFDKAAQALSPHVRLAKVDTQSHPDAAIRYQIRGIPAFILFHKGQELARFTGARPAAEILRLVRAALAPA
jgi:thioredoxin 2